MPNIVIAMPCAQGVAKMQAAQTAVDTCVALRDAGHAVRFVTLDVSNVVYARNYLASWTLKEGADKLLFIDSDMSFSPKISLRLLASGKDVIGAAYPARQVSMDRVVDLARRSPTAKPASIFGQALTYVIRRADRTFRFEDGLAEVEGIGMGAALISTSVLRTMIETGAARPLKASPADGFPMHGFFDLLDSEDGTPLSEDLSFCARWRSLGGKIHAIDSAGVGHVGNFLYEGSFVDSLAAGERQG
jgi:hypothetical protein